MKNKVFLTALALVFALVFGLAYRWFSTPKTAAAAACAAICCQKTANTRELVCRLTTPELDRRKATILNEIRLAVRERQELSNGYAFQFKGDDANLDRLAEFVKSERQCCAFFDFTLKVADRESPVWLEITGPEGAKAFIETELGL